MRIFKRAQPARPVVADEEGRVHAIDIDLLIRRSNRKITTTLAGLTGTLLLLGVVVNASRVAVEAGTSSTRVQLANNERNDCITSRRSDQAQYLGEMVVYNQRALGAVRSDQPAVQEIFAKLPLGTIDQELSKGVEASLKWAAVTRTLMPENLNKPVTQGGCGAPITKVPKKS